MFIAYIGHHQPNETIFEAKQVSSCCQTFKFEALSHIIRVNSLDILSESTLYSFSGAWNCITLDGNLIALASVAFSVAVRSYYYSEGKIKHAAMNHHHSLPVLVMGISNQPVSLSNMFFNHIANHMLTVWHSCQKYCVYTYLSLQKTYCSFLTCVPTVK